MLYSIYQSPTHHLSAHSHPCGHTPVLSLPCLFISHLSYPISLYTQALVSHLSHCHTQSLTLISWSHRHTQALGLSHLSHRYKLTRKHKKKPISPFSLLSPYLSLPLKNGKPCISLFSLLSSLPSHRRRGRQVVVGGDIREFLFISLSLFWLFSHYFLFKLWSVVVFCIEIVILWFSVEIVVCCWESIFFFSISSSVFFFWQFNNSR